MKKVVVLLALALAAVALVACGGDDNGTTPTTGSGDEATNGAATGGGTGGKGSTVKFEADPNGQLAYTTTEASAKAGEVTLELNNPQSLQHDVEIEDSSGEDVGKTELISSGSTSTTIKDLKPGEYTFYCSVPGHRQAGMEGTLTVK